MTEDDVRRICRQEVALHEVRFTLLGLGIGACGVLGWLVGTGQF